MIGYTLWVSPSEQELARKQAYQDSIALVQQQLIDSIKKSQIDFPQQNTELSAQDVSSSVSENTTATENFQDLQSKFASFANSSVGEDETYIIESDLVKLEISNKGGFIRNVEIKGYQTYDSLPLILFDPDHTGLGLSFFANNRAINTEKLYFKPSGNLSKYTKVSGNDSLQFSMRLYIDAGEGQVNPDKYIEYLYVIKGNDYMLDFDVNMVRVNDVISNKASFIGLNWYADLIQQEKTIDQMNGSTIYYKFYQDDVDYLSETDDDEELIKTKLKWISFKQRFFTSTMVARTFFGNGKLTTFTKESPENNRYLKSMSTELDMPINFSGSTNIPLSFYFGPNKFYTLKSYGMELERQIPIGWSFFLLAWINQYIVIPVFAWLGGYGWNYGIVILLLTVLLKIFLFPIAYKTYQSSAKMRVLKPEVDEISAKFPKKEDAMKKQQAVMALYKKAGANPASGCVPMLLQMPILIAMFRFFPASIELRQQSFLWAHDLSSYDSIMTLPWDIPFYGDHVSLFTLLMTVSTIMYTYLNNQMMGSQTQAMPGMKTMMYLMPIMFLGIFNSYASGLSYYYFLANVFTFGQMFVFRYTINEDKLRAQIEVNKQKPAKKKSGFQKRLEEAAKQKGYKANK